MKESDGGRVKAGLLMAPKQILKGGGRGGSPKTLRGFRGSNKKKHTRNTHPFTAGTLFASLLCVDTSLCASTYA